MKTNRVKYFDGWWLTKLNFLLEVQPNFTNELRAAAKNEEILIQVLEFIHAGISWQKLPLVKKLCNLIPIREGFIWVNCPKLVNPPTHVLKR